MFNMKFTRPMNFGILIRKVYYIIFLILICFNIKQAFSIPLIDIINFVELVSSFIVVIFSFIYIATNFLLNYLSFNIKYSIDRLTTAEFTEIESFWKQTYDFARNKVMFFGTILGFSVLFEYIILNMF